MLMGYIFLKCPQCDRRVRHHAKDVATRTVRICPKCGTSIQVSLDLDSSPTDQLESDQA